MIKKKKDSNKIRIIIFYFITDGPWAKVESRKVDLFIVCWWKHQDQDILKIHIRKCCI